MFSLMRKKCDRRTEIQPRHPLWWRSNIENHVLLIFGSHEQSLGDHMRLIQLHNLSRAKLLSSSGIRINTKASSLGRWANRRQSESFCRSTSRHKNDKKHMRDNCSAKGKDWEEAGVTHDKIMQTVQVEASITAVALRVVNPV